MINGSQMDFMPASRTTDPETSHEAERLHTILGKRSVRCRQVLTLVALHPGSTTGEMSRQMVWKFPDLPIATAVEAPHKRVVDLEAKGLVRRGNPRKCKETGSERLTWWLTTTGYGLTRELLQLDGSV
jgi:hypothetical protein